MTGERIPELERVGQTSRTSIGGNQKGKRGKDMKTFKKVLASALAAAMVVTAFPVANAEAASTAKLSATKATLYVGQSKTLKVTTPKTWKSVKVKATSSKKSVASVKKSGKKVTVKAVKAGTAKVTVKVTAKKGKKAVKKTLTFKATVKNPTLTLQAANQVTVGAKETVKATVKPASTKVTFSSSDETIATVDASGVVTGVKTGKVTITAKAGKTTKTVDMEVKNYVLTGVAQTKLTELVATVAGSTKDLKTTDFAVKNATTNVVYPVSKVTVDAKDATKVTLTLFSELKDAANYDVTLDGVTKSFKASDGKVANIALNTATVPYATETEIKLVSKDANGVVIDEVAYGTTNASYDFAIDAKGNGYTNGSKLYLNKVGDTAEATITYKSGKYDQNGKAEGNIGPNKVTITAVEQSAINSFAVRIDDSTKASFEKAKDTNKIAVGDASKAAFFCIKNADGKEITDYSGYSVESSDKTVLMIATPTLGTKHEVGITAVKTGTAYILFKDKDGKIVNSVAVEVVAEKAVTTIELDKYSVIASNESGLAAKTVKIKLKDQYGNDWSGSYDTTATFLSSSNGKTANDMTGLVTVAGKNITINATGKVAGNYVYKIAYNKDGKEVVAKTLTVSVQAPTGTVNSYRLDLSETSVDVKVDNDNKTTKTITAELMGLAGGVDKEVTTGVNYTVKKADGTVVYGGDKNVTGAAFSIDGNSYGVTPAPTKTLTIKLVDVDGTGKATKNLAAGTYYVTAEKTIDSKKVSITSSFTVTDSQTKASVSVKENVVTATTVKAALEAALSVTYGDDVYCNRADKPDGAKALTIVKAEGQLNNGTKITDASSVTVGQYFTVTKLVVTVTVATGVTMDVEVSVPGTITIKI